MTQDSCFKGGKCFTLLLLSIQALTWFLTVLLCSFWLPVTLNIQADVCVCLQFKHTQVSALWVCYGCWHVWMQFLSYLTLKSEPAILQSFKAHTYARTHIHMHAHSFPRVLYAVSDFKCSWCLSLPFWRTHENSCMSVVADIIHSLAPDCCTGHAFQKPTVLDSS